MEIICLGKNRKITITARGNTISYCGCEDCKAQMEKIKEFLDKQKEINKDGRMKISSMRNFIESIDMEEEVFKEINLYLQKRYTKSKSGYMTIKGISTFIKSLKGGDI